MAEPELDEASMEALFSAKKKKKKTKVVDANAGDVTELAAGGGSSAPALVDDGAAIVSVGAAQSDGDPELSYDDMLSRVYNLLNENNPELVGR
jgi:hypothetical protein